MHSEKGETDVVISTLDSCLVLKRVPNSGSTLREPLTIAGANPW